MTVGPVSYTVVAFPGNKFNGNVAPEVEKLVRSGLVRVLDLVFVLKDENGDSVTLEFDQLEDLLPFGELEGEVGGLINEEDLSHVADELPPGNAALAIVWEDLWAKPLVAAVQDSGGVVVDTARIPAQLVEAALEELAAAGGS